MKDSELRAKIIQRLAAYWLIVFAGGSGLWWIWQHGFAGLLAGGTLVALGLMAI